jgi:hypothetical protein
MFLISVSSDNAGNKPRKSFNFDHDASSSECQKKKKGDPLNFFQVAVISSERKLLFQHLTNSSFFVEKTRRFGGT